MTVGTTETRVRELVEREAGRGMRGGDPLAEGLLDSVSMIRLLGAVEEAFGLAIPPEEVLPENFASVPALAALLDRLR